MSKPAAATESLAPAPAARDRLERSFAAGAASARTLDHERHQSRRLLVVLLIMSGFFVVQLAGAIWADSDVLRAEAVHLLTDVAALGLAFLAMRVAIRRPTARFTYGLRRAEPVAAIFNALFVLTVTGFIVKDAISDLALGSGPRPDRMLYIAAAGLVVNGIAAWLIHAAIGSHAGFELATAETHAHLPATAADSPCEDLRHPHIAQHARHGGHGGHSVNLRGAWLHLLGDALGSLAALVAALAVKFGSSPKADAIASFVVAAILVYGAVRLLNDAVLILLEASPSHLSVDDVKKTVLETAGVAMLHDLHVWMLGTGHEAVTAHVSATQPDPTLAARIEEALRRKFHVEYVTIQVEVGGVTCQAGEV